MPKTQSGFTIIDVPVFDDVQIKKIQELRKQGKEKELDAYIEEIISGKSTPKKSSVIKQVKDKLTPKKPETNQDKNQVNNGN